MKEVFKPILDTFENEDIKKFAEACLDTVPAYFLEVGASSTGKYHPQYALGTLGLARHTLALCRFMNHMFSLDCIKERFNSRERDLMRIAGMMHDSRKSGSQEDYERSKWTKFDHPLLAAEAVRSVEKIIPDSEIETIATAIESHMGQWCVDSRHPDVTLPLPENKYQILLHVCDYLASRKDIEVLFDGVQIKEEPPTVETWKLTFGKHKGKTLLEVQEEDPSYIYWAKENVTSEPCKTLVKQL